MTAYSKTARERHGLSVRCLVRVALVLTCLAHLVPSAVQAQVPRKAISILLFAVRDLPEGAPAVVLVSSKNLGDNQILLDESLASPEDLAGAVEMVRLIRARYPDSLPADIRAVASPVRRGSLKEPDLRASRNQLEVLKRAKSKRVNGKDNQRMIILTVHAEPTSRANPKPG